MMEEGLGKQVIAFTFPFNSSKSALKPRRYKLSVCPGSPKLAVRASAGHSGEESNASTENSGSANKPKEDTLQRKGLTRRRMTNKRPSVFEATIDNMTMKRMGRGTIYYGERIEVDNNTEESDLEVLKPDAVLVTGATGRTGQWITLGLTNQDINVRCFTRKFSRAEDLFGPSGTNVDVFEGNIKQLSNVCPAVEGAVAIVCASGGSRWIPGALESVDVNGVANLVSAAREAGTVRRFVLISANDDNASPRARAKRKAERIVIDSGLPYMIIRVAALSDNEGGVKRIVIHPVNGESNSSTSSSPISRVDLAQCVCQGLVHERKLSSMISDDDSSEILPFPNCIFSVENTDEPLVPDKRFWTNSFNRIEDAFQSNPDFDEENSV